MAQSHPLVTALPQKAHHYTLRINRLELDLVHFCKVMIFARRGYFGYWIWPCFKLEGLLIEHGIHERRLAEYYSVTMYLSPTGGCALN